MKQYLQPEIELVRFQTCDVLDDSYTQDPDETNPIIRNNTVNPFPGP